jgi:NTP pyrophosphatase (non-canonical NTP hydrolase)
MNDAVTTVAELKKLMSDFIAERQWEQFHDAKNLAASIAIEAAELMEHFQWLKNDELDKVRNDAKAMAEVREEIADILAYTLSFARAMDIDLASSLEAKMKKNALKYPAATYRGRFRAE